jgi:hypothetical protein
MLHFNVQQWNKNFSLSQQNHPAKNNHNKICKKNRIGRTLYEICHFMCKRIDRKEKRFRIVEVRTTRRTTRMHTMFCARNPTNKALTQKPIPNLNSNPQEIAKQHCYCLTASLQQARSHEFSRTTKTENRHRISTCKVGNSISIGLK